MKAVTQDDVKVINFEAIAEKLGVPMHQEEVKPLNKPGIKLPPVDPNKPLPKRTVIDWDKESYLKLIEEVDLQSKDGGPIMFNSHVDGWVVSALARILKKNGADFYVNVMNKFIYAGGYQTGVAPEDQTVHFNMEEKGDDIHIDVVMEKDPGPEVSSSGLLVPEIPAGKNLYITFDFHNTFPCGMCQTYGEICNAIFVVFNGEFYCSVSNSDQYKVGDIVKSPF